MKAPLAFSLVTLMLLATFPIGNAQLTGGPGSPGYPVHGGFNVTDEDGDLSFQMLISPEYTDYTMLFTCYDFQDVYDNPSEIREAYRNVVGTDVALACYIDVSGQGAYFFGSEFGYAVNGVSYSVGYDGYSMINGDDGEVRDGTQVAIAIGFTEAERGDDITLYYDDQEYTFRLWPWNTRTGS